MLDRNAIIARIASSSATDVLIVGGGINGCAVFRELALQGVSCLLVDREDFGAGASSASTRMAHGGLRYLENGEFRLVAEATRERNRLLRNAPHLVSPLLVTVPSFSVLGGIVPSIAKLFGIEQKIPSRGVLLLKLGMTLYDVLGRRQGSLGRHAMTSAAKARRMLPELHPAVRGLASYYDAKIAHPERIAFELVADALTVNPNSMAINHCALLRGEGANVVLRDRLSGKDHIVTPRLVVNASGAWIDHVLASLGPTRPVIGGTKGSHLVIDNPALHDAMHDRAFSFDDGTGRMCIAYPIGGMVLLGSTDIRVTEPDEAICDDVEIDYLIGAIRIIFPTVDVGREQVCFRFCGVRPLPRSTSTTTVNISRDHSIVRREPDDAVPYPVLALVGGKWTTFRAFAEQAADQVLRAIGASRTCHTADTPIGGGRDYPLGEDARRTWLGQVATATGCTRSRMVELFERYGTRAEAVAGFCSGGRDRELAAAPEYSEREILFLIRHEMARTLDDLIYRRTTLAMWGRLSFPLLVELAALIGNELSVSADELLRAIVPRLLRENGIDYVADLRRHGATETDRQTFEMAAMKQPFGRLADYSHPP